MDYKTLASFVANYSIDLYDIDKNDIIDFLSIAIQSGGLTKYVDDIAFQNYRYGLYEEQLPTVAMYYNSSSKKTIYIYENALIDYMFRNPDVPKTSAMRKLYLFQVLLHELEHVKQIKGVELNDLGLEYQILKNSLLAAEMMNIQNQRLLCKTPEDEDKLMSIALWKKRVYSDNKQYNYHLSPEERFAEYNSFEELYKIMSCLNVQENIYKHFYQLKVGGALRAYDNINRNITSPTITYISNQDPDKLKNLMWYNPEYPLCLMTSQYIYGLDERVKCGLPITDNEYEEYKRKLVN